MLVYVSTDAPTRYLAGDIFSLNGMVNSEKGDNNGFTTVRVHGENISQAKTNRIDITELYLLVHENGYAFSINS